MGISVQITWTTDPLIEKPGPWDDFSYWQLLVHSMLAVLFISTLLFYRRKYQPLYAKSVGKVSIAVIFCTVHLTALYIGNEQNSLIKPWVHKHCGFVNFWLQYLFGLHPWFLFMLERMITFGTLMKNEFSITDPRKRLLGKVLLLVMFTMPLLAICAVDAISELSFFREDIETCSSIVSIKMCILLWTLFGFGILYAANTLINRRMPIQVLNEFLAIRDAMVLAFISMVYSIGINFTGFQNYAFWRASQLLVLELMYGFCFMRLVLSTLIKAVRDDREYVIQFKKSLNITTITTTTTIEKGTNNNENITAIPIADHLFDRPSNYKDVLARPLLRQDFLKYCDGAGAFHILSSASRTTESQSFYASQYIACLNSINGINMYGSRTIYDLDKLMNTFLRQDKCDPVRFVYIHEACLKKLEKFIETYKKVGIENIYEFQMELSNEIHYILGSHFFENYCKLRMPQFYKEVLEASSHAELDMQLVVNESGLLTDSVMATQQQQQQQQPINNGKSENNDWKNTRN